MQTLIAQAIAAGAPALGRKIGICGQAPSDYPEFATFLVECGIDSMSLNPDAVLSTTHWCWTQSWAAKSPLRELALSAVRGRDTAAAKT